MARLVTASWDSTEVISHYFPQVPGWGVIQPNLAI